MTAQIVEILRSPDYLRFSFVRNPYGRLVSAWKSKLAWDDPQYRQLRASIREVCDYPVVGGQRAGPISFRDAVQCLLADPGVFDDHIRVPPRQLASRMTPVRRPGASPAHRPSSGRWPGAG